MPENRKPGHSTGPTSVDGKERSSQNSFKHGGCSKRLIVPGENEEDFLALRQGWMDDYQPWGPVAEMLVEEAAIAQWLLIRARKNYNEMEHELRKDGKNPVNWSDEEHHQLEKFLRYQTTAERSFSRALANVERMRASRMREERAAEKREQQKQTKEAEPVKAKKPAVVATGNGLFSGQSAKKNQREIPVLDQWVEVEIHDGKTVTNLYPSNDELIEEGKKMDPPPELVYRRFNFRHGVPLEYHWATTNNARRENGGGGIQRMTVDTWLEVIAREKVEGHLGPTGVGNLPRPKEHGGCECEVCMQNAEVVEGE